MPVEQVTVLLFGALAILFEVLYVPKKVFYIVGSGRSLVVTPKVYAWLWSMPANSSIITDIIVVEIAITVVLVVILFLAVMFLRKPSVNTREAESVDAPNTARSGEMANALKSNELFSPNPAGIP